MKKLLLSVALSSMALAGCSTMGMQNSQDLIVDGEVKTVKVINIPSFQVEIDPNKAVCDIPDTMGNIVKGECLQYRQPFQKNFNTMAAPINGFIYEPGYRYLLDVRQEAVADTENGVIRPVWYLNNIISKTPEMIP